jgi:antitoxin VapB
MNKHEPPPKPREAAIFKSNRSQAVRIPKDLAFAEGVKKVEITRTEDGGLLIKPVKQGSWAEYFARPSLADPDFLADRDQGEWEDRESF